LFEEKEEISNQLKKMKEILNENFNVLEQERKEKSRIELELQKLKEKIESSNTVLNNLNYRLNEEDLNTNETVWLKEQLEKEIEKNQKMHLELEIKNEENEIVLYEAITMEYQYEQTTENHEQIMKENKFLQNRVNDLQKELNESFAVLEKRRKEKRREIKDRWGLYFPKFDIETRVFRDALNYTAEELKEIEAILISLHSTENPRILSRGKVNDGGIYYDHVGVNTINVPTRILYQVDKKKDKLVTIVRLYKHNEKYMS
ncbi:hypothetical protein EAC14_11900, partial [Enterococcus faecium]|nr:hypothetical protein [Enterococcus faecium]